jgi:hypothetical protein
VPWTIAELAVETQIPHREWLWLMEHEPELFETTMEYLKHKAWLAKVRSRRG